MKKITSMLITLVLAIAICLGTLSGCALIQKNSERDMNQVVATVQINKDAKKDEITKREVVIMYLNYGYTYVQSYGYTVADTIQLIVDSLVQNRILVQKACEVMYEEREDKSSIKAEDKFEAVTYLTEDQKTEALYNTMKSFNDIIDSYIEKEDTETTESYSETVRTTPANKTLSKDAEVTVEEMETYIEKGINNGAEDADVKLAYNKTIEALKRNDLLGDDFDYNTSDIKTSAYYKDNLDSNYESQLLTAYDNYLRKQALANVTVNDLTDRYTEMYNTQVNTYGKSAADYETALGKVDGNTTKVVYNPYTGYGYVYNLLLPLDSYMSTELDGIKADLASDKITQDEFYSKRNEIFARLTVTDLRSTWVTNNYDYDKETGFGEYSAYPFQGTVEQVKEDDPATKENEAKYIVTALKEFSLDAFLAEFENYVYGKTLESADVPSELQAFTYANKEVEAIEDMKAFRTKVDEMIFAYSSDPGSLTSYKGYTAAPKPAIDGTETYVQEFADAARYIVNQKVGSYVMVATDYGYHVMICSEVINADTNYETLWELVEELDGMNETEAKAALKKFMTTDVEELTDEEKETYLYKFFTAYIDSYVSDYKTNTQNAFVNEIKEDSNRVKLYESRYADLK